MAAGCAFVYMKYGWPESGVFGTETAHGYPCLPHFALAHGFELGLQFLAIIRRGV